MDGVIVIISASECVSKVKKDELFMSAFPFIQSQPKMQKPGNNKLISEFFFSLLDLLKCC